MSPPITSALLTHVTAAWPAWACLLVVAPVLEESLLRAGLHESLLRRWPGGRSWALGCTTLLFGLSHAVLRGPWLGAAVLLPAWGLGRLYQAQRRLAPCVALHALFNLAWLLGLGAFPSTP